MVRYVGRGIEDPHRNLYWPPDLGLSRHRPDVIHCQTRDGYRQDAVRIAAE
jgi:hypothetical protein